MTAIDSIYENNILDDIHFWNERWPPLDTGAALGLTLDIPGKILSQVVAFVERDQLNDGLEVSPRRQIVQCVIILDFLVDFHVLDDAFIGPAGEAKERRRKNGMQCNEMSAYGD